MWRRSIRSIVKSSPCPPLAQRTGVQAGETVLVIGCGVIGLGAIAACSCRGAHVIAVDIVQNKLALAKEMGATHTIHTRIEDLSQKIREYAGGAVQVAIEAIGLPATMAQAVQFAGNGGRVGLVGYGSGDLRLNSNEIIRRELSIFGSRNALQKDFYAVRDTMLKGLLSFEKLISATYPAEQGAQAFAGWEAAAHSKAKFVLTEKSMRTGGFAMHTVILGKTGIAVNHNGFGALPIQRVERACAVALLRRAYEGGIDFFDTSRQYTDSEEKMGEALGDVRRNIVIATKSMAATKEALRQDLETSLMTLRTDYVDLYQFHNPAFCPKPGDGTGLYEEMLAAKKAGMIRHIGITSHSMAVAQEAIDSGLYETLQFPFSYLSSKKDSALLAQCQDAKMGFIAMKALSGGLITNARAACAYFSELDGVLPIWGIQREAELGEFLSYIKNPPHMDEATQNMIVRDRKELQGSFCRSCGYCMPCPAGIEIRNCARMSFNIRRMPKERWLTEEWQEKMRQIQNCLNCGACIKKCPYNLDIPALLKHNYQDYMEILAGKPVG